MIYGKRLQDIAFTIRNMADPAAKKYICDRWEDVKTKINEENYQNFIDAILEEEIEELTKFI